MAGRVARGSGQGRGRSAPDGTARAPTHRVRRDGWTGERQRGFVKALARYGTVRDACRTVGLSKTSAYRLRAIDPAFGVAWDLALKQAGACLETLAFQRATEGAEEVVIRNGQEVSRKRKPSDAIFRMILQASNPTKYGRTGAQLPVRVREELAAREQAAEERGYRAAFLALMSEYRYQAEPEYARHHLWRRLHIMHTRMCANARCRECHPERIWPSFDEGGDTTPPEDHRPVPPARDWLAPAYDIIDRRRLQEDPNAELVDRNEPPPAAEPALAQWWAEMMAALVEERRALNLAGRQLELGPKPEPREMDPPPLDRLGM